MPGAEPWPTVVAIASQDAEGDETVKRFPGLLAGAGLLVIAAACTASVTNSGPPSAAPRAASPTPLASSGPASAVTPSLAAVSPSGAAGGDAAAWCAIVIDINTRAGYMVDQTYVNPPTPAMTKQVTLEAIARRDEIMSLTPPEIRAAMAAELAYYQVFADWANQNGWDALATSTSVPPPPAEFLAAMAPLTSFQTTQCGIKFE